MRSRPQRRPFAVRWPCVSRRGLIGVASAALLLALTGSGLRSADAQARSPRTETIGIIGAGKMGGTLAKLWATAGYQIMISSDHPAKLEGLAHSIGPSVRVGTPREAASFGSVVLISVPYKALPPLGRELAPELAGKIVLDTGNPYPQRDGAMAEAARREGTGVASAKYLPGVRLVRAFNAIKWTDLRSQAHRAGELVGIPLAGSDRGALAVAARLVRDAGFEPVIVGDLSTARKFDVDTPVYVKLLTARQLREQLGLKVGH
ncbi:MAG: NADPH-dependent F420 reductase [Steroidobacteraceae bacterium]